MGRILVAGDFLSSLGDRLTSWTPGGKQRLERRTEREALSEAQAVLREARSKGT